MACMAVKDTSICTIRCNVGMHAWHALEHTKLVQLLYQIQAVHESQPSHHCPSAEQACRVSASPAAFWKLGSLGEEERDLVSRPCQLAKKTQ